MEWFIHDRFSFFDVILITLISYFIRSVLDEWAKHKHYPYKFSCPKCSFVFRSNQEEVTVRAGYDHEIIHERMENL